jgi:hypothetical protein
MLEEVVELLPVLADFSSDQGTATCFDPPEVELEVADVGEVVPVLPEEDVLSSLELVEPLRLLELSEPFKESTAKSTFPEVGLMTTSLIVPIVSPDEDFTSALVNWLALMS